MRCSVDWRCLSIAGGGGGGGMTPLLSARGYSGGRVRVKGASRIVLNCSSHTEMHIQYKIKAEASNLLSF
jgi:hypothetical protein